MPLGDAAWCFAEGESAALQIDSDSTASDGMIEFGPSECVLFFAPKSYWNDGGKTAAPDP